MIDVERTPNHKRPKDALFLRRLESGSMGRWTWGICVVVGMLLFASRELHGQQMLIPDTVIQASQAELAAAPGGSPSPTSADQFTDQREAIDSHLPPLDASATPNPASQTSGTVSDAFPADGSSRQDEKPGYAPELSAASDEPIANIANQVKDWLPMDRLQSSVQLVASMTLLGVVPALLLMTTSYVRIAVVLALLRQAFGVPNLLPVQVTTALAFFCTGWVMWPTWQLVHEKAVMPLMAGQVSAGPSELWREGISPIRQFMIRQIEANHNSDDVHLFLQRTISKDAYPKSYEEVPLPALLPAFLISELKTAFIIGFQIYLPFLVIDLVVSAVTTSMGMFLLPPAMMSMPLKLLLFVLVDGWHLLIEMLLKSFQ